MRGVVRGTTVCMGLSFRVGRHLCLTPPRPLQPQCRLSPRPQPPDQAPPFSGEARNFPPQWACRCWSQGHRDGSLLALHPQAPGTTRSRDKWAFCPPPWEFCHLSLPGRPGPPRLAPRPNALPLCVQEKKQRRAENLKRRLENERKAEIVQVVSIALLAGRDTARLSVVFQTPRRPCFTAPARAAVPGPRGGLPFPGEQGRDSSHANALPSTSPRSETPPSSSGRRSSSCAPLRSATRWPSCRSSRHSGRQPRSELRMAEAFCGQPPCHTRQPSGHWPHASADPALQPHGSKTVAPPETGL